MADRQDMQASDFRAEQHAQALVDTDIIGMSGLSRSCANGHACFVATALPFRRHHASRQGLYRACQSHQTLKARPASARSESATLSTSSCRHCCRIFPRGGSRSSYKHCPSWFANFHTLQLAPYVAFSSASYLPRSSSSVHQQRVKTRSALRLTSSRTSWSMTNLLSKALQPYQH